MKDFHYCRNLSCVTNNSNLDANTILVLSNRVKWTFLICQEFWCTLLINNFCKNLYIRFGMTIWFVKFCVHFNSPNAYTLGNNTHVIFGSGNFLLSFSLYWVCPVCMLFWCALWRFHNFQNIMTTSTGTDTSTTVGSLLNETNWHLV